MDEWDADPQVRDIVTKTVRESLVAPVIYIKNELRDDFAAVASDLPAHTVHEAQGNQASFSVEFADWEARDKAREVLEGAHVRFRTGKCLLPFRITGNIDWGVPSQDRRRERSHRLVLAREPVGADQLRSDRACREHGRSLLEPRLARLVVRG